MGLPHVICMAAPPQFNANAQLVCLNGQQSQAIDTFLNASSTDDGQVGTPYEAFMDEYVAFMKKYSDNPSDVGLLADYTKYMSKYADMVEKFDKWESEDLNDAELAYYIDVQARVSKKLLDVAG